jgi:hypothetical protein
MHKESRWTRRRPGAGLLLLLVLGVALAVPLWRWHGGHGHPLTGADHVDLCAQLVGLPRLEGLVPGIQPSQGSAGACRWRDAHGHVQLDAMITTTRSATTDAAVGDLDALYANWRDEVRASGAADIVEDKEHGVRRLRYRRGDTREWLVEDHGVMLWLRSATLDAQALAATGDQISRRLHEPSH